MAAHHLFRAFAELLPGWSRQVATDHEARREPSPQARPSQASTERTVGVGAPNETVVSINGVPHLFVDEGDCIVQFQPAFEEAPVATPFGTKILPELAPHWSPVREHGGGLKDAIASAIRVPVQPAGRGKPSEQVGQVEPASRIDTDSGSTGAAEDADQTRPRAARPGTSRGEDMLASTVGRVLSWGEEKFPNRKPTGKPFYTSFAMHIETAAGERTLQGEGLKDAIAQSRCQVGDVVSVRRLEKVKVPAFAESGRPILKNGQPVMWDKWLWSITR